jgi:hypothetical protein
LRRELRSAERLSDAAIFFGSVSLKTPCFRSSASLSRVTRCDQRFGDIFLGDGFLRAALALRAVVLAVFLRVVLRVAGLRTRVFRRSAILYSLLFQPKNGDGPDRFRCRDAGNSRVPRAFINVAGTKVADSMVPSLRTPRFQAFSHWFHPSGLQLTQSKSALNRGAPISVEVANGKQRSKAAWPA